VLAAFRASAFPQAGALLFCGRHGVSALRFERIALREREKTLQPEVQGKLTKQYVPQAEIFINLTGIPA
jgi:hypothetical protein